MKNKTTKFMPDFDTAHVRELARLSGIELDEDTIYSLSDEWAIEDAEVAAEDPDSLFVSVATDIRKMEGVICRLRRRKNLRPGSDSHLSDELRALLKAWTLLAKARSAFSAGKERNVGGIGVLATVFFSQAVGLSFFAGKACAELKSRVAYSQLFGSHEFPKRQGESRLMRKTREAVQALRTAGKKPTTADLRDYIACPKNGITFENDAFHWKDDKGQDKVTRDSSWEKMAAKARKSPEV